LLGSAGPRLDAELLELSELDADLLVVGRRGRGGFVEMLVGSASHKLATAPSYHSSSSRPAGSPGRLNR
jgi:nucleotide-binding universal stress UspA family protein